MNETDDGGRRDDGGGEPDDTVVEILGFEDDDPEPAPKRPAAAAARAAAPADGAELAAEKERYLRLRADFDNFRKRAERERAEAERYALAEPARQLLPVMDNLARALAASAAATSGGAEELRRGVEMILRQLEDALRRFGVVAVPALGQRFDPSVHEAVAHEESDEVAAPTVVAEFQRGYKLNERLIRPAMVKVALPPHEEGDAGEPGDAAGGPSGDAEGEA